MTPPETITAAGLLRYGPLAVRYTDIPHNGDKLDLWTPQVGDILLRLFSDWQTVTQWDHGSLFVGQNVNGETYANAIMSVNGLHIARTNESNSFDLSVNVTANAQGYDATGTPWFSSAYVFHTADPVQIQLAQVGENPDPTQGYVEIYGIVLRAVVAG